MAYCRFGEADAYAFCTWHPEDRSKRMFECCACSLDEGSFPLFETAEELFWHLVKHRLAGHFIPDGALNEIMEDCLTTLL